MIENQNGSIKAQDLDTIMAVGIFAKNVQIVDSVGVGFREPAEIPRIKEHLMSALRKVECTVLCGADVGQMEMFDLSAGCSGDRVIVSPGASTPPHLCPRPFGDKFCQQT